MSGFLTEHFSRDLIMFLFAVSGGITFSGIIASTYRLAARKPQSKAGTVLHYAVMAFAGPSVLLGNATRSYRKESCSNLAYVMAIAVASYWAFVLGMGILTVYGVIK
ncbi:MAG TPA: hypothetical protein VN935_07750 [Rhizomicrobium sp.]|jgi:hypothetical protein|nr:hypothetical protein [Rhizomicrobium sp.]